MPRTQSAASQQAAAYLKLYPRTTAQDLAEKFGLSISAVQRAKYWKEREFSQSKKKEKA